jgi:hypothetical protein
MIPANGGRQDAVEAGANTRTKAVTPDTVQLALVRDRRVTALDEITIDSRKRGV